MFSLGSSHRYYLYSEPTDMRKSFDGLAGLVRNKLAMPLTTGQVFVFINKRGDRVKLLHWEAGGFVLYYKRLEQGVLERPVREGKATRISWPQLVMMVEGIRLEGLQKRTRYAGKKGG